jgi:dTDP-4-amino-4,6-dideoxygalactose transaminase
MIKLVDLQKQEASILNEIKSALFETVERRDFILGKALTDFEKHLATFVGKRYALGTGSGGAALTIALRALRLNNDDEVITQPNSHISTVYAALSLGAHPVFVDVDSNTFQMNPEKLKAAITPRTKVILPVHMCGYAAPMREILDIAKEHNLHVVEDTAHAVGSYYGKVRCGAFGVISAFSFYPGKNLGCWGDGGAILTDDEKLANEVRLLRSYGDARKNYHSEMGINSRLDTIQAAVLNVKLKMLDQWNEQRRTAASWYHRWFQELGVTRFVHLPPLEIPGQLPNFHLFVIRVAAEKRDRLYEYMHSQGIECGIHYPLPIHLQQVLSPLGYCRGNFPVAEELAQTVLSLPMYAGLTEEECCLIAQTVSDFF